MDKEYLLLFNTITDTIEQLDKLKDRLMLVQQEAEELYISRAIRCKGFTVPCPPQRIRPELSEIPRPR